MRAGALAAHKRPLVGDDGDYHGAPPGIGKVPRRFPPVAEQPGFDEAYSFLGQAQESPQLAPLSSKPDSLPEQQLSFFGGADADGDDSAILYESESPIGAKASSSLSNGVPMPGSVPPVPPVTMITDIIESRLREYLKGLQLTRDFLRTIQQQPMFMLNTQNFFVRLNMGSRYFLYVAAQIVNITGDELQVRGVDKHMPNKVQSTKLAYVSNASFKEEEITDLMTKLRQESILNLPVGKVLQMIEGKNRIANDPAYKFLRQQIHSASQAAAAPAPAPAPTPAPAPAPAPPSVQPASMTVPLPAAVPSSVPNAVSAAMAGPQPVMPPALRAVAMPQQGAPPSVVPPGVQAAGMPQQQISPAQHISPGMALPLQLPMPTAGVMMPPPGANFGATTSGLGAAMTGWPPSGVMGVTAPPGVMGVAAVMPTMAAMPMGVQMQPPTAGMQPPAAGMPPPGGATPGMQPSAAAMQPPTPGTALQPPTPGMQPPVPGLQPPMAGMPPHAPGMPPHAPGMLQPPTPGMPPHIFSSQ